MSVTISPQPEIGLNINSWESPYFQEDVVSDPYTITYDRSDASMSALKIEFSHLGPLRFCESDGETPIDAPVYIRNGSGVFRFRVRVNYQILNEQANNITFRGLVKTTEESQTTTTTTTTEPWYEITFDPGMGPLGVFDTEYSNTAEVMVYLQQTTVNSSGDFVATRKVWPDENFVVTAVDRQSDDHVKLAGQVREGVSFSTQTRIKLVFENMDVDNEVWSESAKFIVKPAPLGKYKDQNGQPIEATIELRTTAF